MPHSLCFKTAPLAAALLLFAACDRDDADGDDVEGPATEPGESEEEESPSPGDETREGAAGDETAPAFATEGRIYFYGTSESDILLAEPGGRVTSFTGELDLRGAQGGPTVSPGGDRIAFRGRAGRDEHGIFTVNRDGEDLQHVTPTHETSAIRRPAWSPDGSEIAYAGPPEQERADIWVIDADGGEPENLTEAIPDAAWEEADLDPERGLGTPAWSPDGDRIAFTVAKGSSSEIAMIDRDDPETVHSLTKELGHQDKYKEERQYSHQVRTSYPAFSPDGSVLAFSAEGIRRGDIYLLDLGGDELTQVTDSEHTELAPSWSPDGTQIAFHSDQSDDGRDIFVIDRDGENQQRITRKEGWVLLPAWSP